jgi:alpha-1,2-glucosyltransferase
MQVMKQPLAGDGRGFLFERNAWLRVGFWTLWVLIYLAGARYYAWTRLPIGDEYVHWEQIRRFLAGDFRIMTDYLTTLPGYHLLVAGVLHSIGWETLSVARVLNALIALSALAGFHALRRQALGRDDFLATASFAVLPIMFPFAFMVYTDLLSVALMLWVAWAAGNSRHWLAGALLLAAIGVRQNNVLWIALFALPLCLIAWQQRGTELRHTLFALTPYAIAGSAFMVFWIWNGSVSLSTPQAHAHPDFKLSSGNLFYLLFVAAILFVFLFLHDWREFIVSLRTRPWLLLLPLGVAVLYWLTFHPDHPYNQIFETAAKLLGVPEPIFLRNRILHATQTTPAWSVAFCMLAIMGMIGFAKQRLMRNPAWLFWSVSVLFVSLSWLIESRYFLIPYALFFAWRTPGARWAEWATFLLWLPLAALFFWGMRASTIFL